MEITTGVTCQGSSEDGSGALEHEFQRFQYGSGPNSDPNAPRSCAAPSLFEGTPFQSSEWPSSGRAAASTRLGRAEKTHPPRVAGALAERHGNRKRVVAFGRCQDSSLWTQEGR